jgi:GNAT superfamily N-acetyltransferase
VVIRSAALADAEALAGLSGQLGYPCTGEQVAARLSALLDDAERTVLVAEVGRGLAGFIDVHVQRVVEADPYAEVGGLVVDERLRHSGLGAALLAAAAAWGRERGLGVMWIRANLARRGSHELYRRVGCSRVKDQRVYGYTL